LLPLLLLVSVALSSAQVIYKPVDPIVYSTPEPTPTPLAIIYRPVDPVVLAPQPTPAPALIYHPIDPIIYSTPEPIGVIADTTSNAYVPASSAYVVPVAPATTAYVAPTATTAYVAPASASVYVPATRSLYVPQTTKVIGGNPCSVAYSTGNGDAFVPSWAWDSVSSTCVKFTYTGEGGDANRYQTADACYAACGPTTTIAADQNNSAGAIGFNGVALVLAVVVGCIIA